MVVRDNIMFVKNYCNKVIRYVEFKFRIFYEFFTGVDFSSIESTKTIGLNSNDFYRGSSSGDRYLKHALAELRINVNDTILDVGSAKGSALRVFSDFPFKHIAGIEISTKLAEISERNFKKLGLDVCVYNIDARDFSQYKNYNYFYFYNPCAIEILEVIINRIVSQNINQRKTIKVLFNNPPEEDSCPFIKLGFKRIKYFPDKWGNGMIYYELEF